MSPQTTVSDDSPNEPRSPRSQEVKTPVRNRGRTYGYARVSTRGQTHDLQLDALRAAGVMADGLVVETVSGAAEALPRRDALITSLRPGDTLVVWALDRLGRRAVEVASLVDELQHRGVRLVITTMSIDTGTTLGQMMATVLAYLAQMEREHLTARTRAGLDAARRRGRVGGRPPALDADGHHAVRRLREGGFTHAQIASTMNVSVSTVKRALRKYADHQ